MTRPMHYSKKLLLHHLSLFLDSREDEMQQENGGEEKVRRETGRTTLQLEDYTQGESGWRAGGERMCVSKRAQEREV